MEATSQFAQLARLPDAAVPLDRAALLIAAHAHPGLDIGTYLARLDALAQACPTPTLDSLVAHLFRGGRFRGNRDDYYDPRNSLLCDVLDRGLGIPISLSVLALEVGRRIGVPLTGVGMPGHFLVRDKVDPAVFVDPFHEGRMLDEAGCQRLHRSLAGPTSPWDPAWLDPIGPWSILARMLANLRAIYQERGDHHSLVWVARLRALLPDAGAPERAELTRLLAPYN